MSQHDSATAYPLSWPDGWERAKARKTSNPFGSSRALLTFDRARRSLSDELHRLGAVGPVLSSNIPIRGDGMPYADAARRKMEDPGVAVYFMLRGKRMVMAQDAYWDIAANFRSLALAIEAMRQLERHGGGTMMEKAFYGFAALPPPEGSKPRRPWWTVMQYSADPKERELLSVAEVKARYATLAKRLHPDAGGTAEAFSELNQARDDAFAELGGA